MIDFFKYLEISLGHFSPVLISKSNKQVLLNLASCLPEMFAKSLFIYEKKLLDDSGESDLSVFASTNNSALDNFNTIFEFPKIAEYTAKSIPWQRIKNLGDILSNNNSRLSEYLEMAVLEFDSASLSQPIIIPSVFLSIESVMNRNELNYQYELFERSSVYIEGLEILSGKKLDKGTRRFIEDITKKSIGNFDIFSAGLMLSRNESPVKICIKSVNSERLINTLPEIIKDEKLFSGINKILQNYGKYFTDFALGIDVLDTGIEKVGIECTFATKKQPPAEKRWSQVFDQLYVDGFCKKEIAEKLIDFPGKIMINPDNKKSHTGYVPTFYAQGLHHIKFSVAADKITFAKVYLWAGFGWDHSALSEQNRN